MSYIGIATKEFGEGRIVLSTDRVSGYRDSGGYSSHDLWRKIFEWVSKSEKFKTIKVGVVSFEERNFESRLDELSPITYSNVTIDDLIHNTIDRYDLLLFVGTPIFPSADLTKRVKSFIENGGGLIIEVPSDKSEIAVLNSFDSVSVESRQRPTLEPAYWTQYGISHYVYSQKAMVSMLISINSNGLSDGWNIILSNVKTYLEESFDDQSVATKGSLISRMGVFQGAYMKNGIVEIEEGDADELTSSSSISDVSTGISLSSSSSSSEYVDWNLCDNMVAHWKMNDNRKNAIISDSTKNISNMSVLYNNIFTKEKIATSIRSVDGKNGSAIYLGSGGNDGIISSPEQTLSFSNNIVDYPFTISVWIYPEDGKGVIASKKNSWHLGMHDYKIYFEFIDKNNNKKRITSINPCVVQNKWQWVVCKTDGIDLYLYINNSYAPVIDSSDNNYIAKNNSSSPIEIGNSTRERFITILSYGEWKDSYSSYKYGVNGSVIDVFTDSAYLIGGMGGDLPPVSYPKGSLVFFFADSGGNPLFHNGTIIHNAGEFIKTSVPNNAESIFFGFHSDKNWQGNEGSINIVLKKWNGTETKTTISSLANIYFYNASEDLYVDFNDGWTDYVINHRPFEINISNDLGFVGAIDNLMIFNKNLSESEASYLWNHGMGVEECYGEYQQISTSSTSSSSIDSSSSSSSRGITSSSSESSLEYSSESSLEYSSSTSESSSSSKMYSESSSSSSQDPSFKITDNYEDLQIWVHDPSYTEAPSIAQYQCLGQNSTLNYFDLSEYGPIGTSLNSVYFPGWPSNTSQMVISEISNPQIYNPSFNKGFIFYIDRKNEDNQDVAELLIEGNEKIAYIDFYTTNPNIIFNPTFEYSDNNKNVLITYPRDHYPQILRIYYD